ncbi:hypothetical protein MLD38_013057 [Melastoma candidum]|uniref:Uncharacterized protein n=1 Tax=Melastoma candidum TaxID=119954 RepID=A0ACB9RCH9_9MYRT|nr:hypothetical protein MLD38_013057 [Melastoma candidum]
MERAQEEMQFLGIFGMFRESYYILRTLRHVFSKITVSLVLPLAFIYLLHLEVSGLIFSHIIHDEAALDQTRPRSPSYERTSDLLSKEWAYFLLFKALYLLLLLVLSLLSTAAVVYAIACAYTGRNLTFSKVMAVVPRVWRRLMLTFLSIFAVAFAYNTVAVTVFVAWVISVGDSPFGLFVTFLLVAAYVAGLLYMTVVWQLSSVVTVLEEGYGFRAMRKSKDLVRGKTWAAAAVFFLLNAGSYLVQVLFEKVVVRREWIGENVAIRVVVGGLSLQLVSILILTGLVVQTVLYLVCKSYHHEHIDKSALSDHLEVYLGEYVPLKAKDVQLQEYEV